MIIIIIIIIIMITIVFLFFSTIPVYSLAQLRPNEHNRLPSPTELPVSQLNVYHNSPKPTVWFHQTKLGLKSNGFQPVVRGPPVVLEVVPSEMTESCK